MNNLWVNKIFSLDSNTVLTNSLVKNYISNFFKEVLKDLSLDKHILILFRLQLNNNSTITLGNMQKINKLSEANYTKYISGILNSKTDQYVTIPVTKVIFSYGVRNGELLETKYPSNLRNISTQTYYKNNFPISFNPVDFGNVIHQHENKYIIFSDSGNYIITQFITENERYNIVEFYKNNILLYTWKDIYISEDSFMRELGKSIYIYENGVLKLRKVNKPVAFMEKLKVKNTRSS